MANHEHLNGKLECATCGTVLLDIPPDADEFTPVQCVKCRSFLGTWGEIQNEFFRQFGSGIFEMAHGRLRRIR